MRKLVAVSATAFAILCCVFSVKAEGIALYVDTQQAYVGRLFEVKISSSMAENIRGGLLTVTYDSELAEFKGANSGSFDVKAKDCTDSVKLVFVTAGEISKDELVTLKFKGKAEGYFDINILCDGIVDQGLNRVYADCSGCSVQVKAKTASDKSSAQDIDEAENVATADSQESKGFYTVNADKSDTKDQVLYIVAAVSATLLLCYSFILLIKRKKPQKSKKPDKL